MAIVYCLGFERAVGPNINVPLPYVMRDSEFRLGGMAKPMNDVLQSYVMVEISNDSWAKSFAFVGMWKEAPTRNSYKHGEEKTLEDFERSGERRDFFLHDPGAAVRDDGFHSFLATFLDFKLPMCAPIRWN